MGIFERLFKKTQKEEEIVQPSNQQEKQRMLTDEWEAVPEYIPVPPEDYDLVSVIATAIAAGDRPDSQFIIKSIKQKNPEVVLTSVIAASFMAGVSQQSQFIVKNIKKRSK